MLFAKKHFNFTVNLQADNVINRIKVNTNQSNPTIQDSEFYGTVTDNSFELQAALSSGRRGLFNPILSGTIKPKNEKLEINVNVKYNKLNYVFILVMALFCIFCGVVCFANLQATKYAFLSFVIPFVVFALVILLIYFSANMNLKDSKTALEELFKNKLVEI